MDSRPETTMEYFQTYGFQEFRDDNVVCHYVRYLNLYYRLYHYKSLHISTTLTTVQDYIRGKLGLKFNGYYFPDSPEEKFKI